MVPGFFRRFLAGENKKVAFRLFSKKTQIGPCQIFKFRFVGGSAFGLSLCAELSRSWQILFTLGHPRDPELTGPTPRMCLLTNGSLSIGNRVHTASSYRRGKAAKSTRLAQSADEGNWSQKPGGCADTLRSLLLRLGPGGPPPTARKIATYSTLLPVDLFRRY